MIENTRNLYKVPTRAWNGWSYRARAVFNRVYDFFYNNPELVLHPKTPDLKPAHIKTLAWNAAWLGADAVDDKLPTEVVEIDRRTKTMKEIKVKTS